jgi:hypothetical protein
MQAERIRFLARDERLARLAGFWWGFAEGLFFFIVPDVYISFAVLFSVRAGAVAWLSSIAGSMVAVCFIYLLTAMPGVDYPGFLATIPGISGGLIHRAGSTLASEGLPYTPLLVFGGVPLKLYAALAFSLGLPLGAVCSGPSSPGLCGSRRPSAAPLWRVCCSAARSTPAQPSGSRCSVASGSGSTSTISSA